MGPTRTRPNRPQPPRGLWAQLRALILQPGRFFRAMPGGQTWLVVALALIMLTGVSEFQRQKRLDAGATDAGGGDMATVVDPGMSGGGDMGGGGMGETPLPPPDAGNGGVSGGSTTSVTEDLSKVLVAGGGVVVIWIINAMLLSLVTLINGYAPRFSRSLRIAVWTTVPLGLMAAFQLVYFAAGGKAGQPGLAGLLNEWHDFSTISPVIQNLLLSITTRMTLFYVWVAALLYVGARYALKGRKLASGFVVVAWVVLVIMLPVLTGAIAVKQPEPEIPPVLELPTDGMPTEESIMAGSDMSNDMSAETGSTDTGTMTDENGGSDMSEGSDEGMTTDEAPVATDDASEGESPDATQDAPETGKSVDTAMATTEAPAKPADVTIDQKVPRK